MVFICVTESLVHVIPMFNDLVKNQEKAKDYEEVFA